MTPLRRLARLGRFAFACVCVVLGAAWAAGADPPKTSFRLPEGDAAVTLRQFSQQARTPIIYPIDLVRGVRTHPVQGTFTAREALDRMVAGTELIVSQDASTGALTVGRSAHPHPAAPSPRNTTQTHSPPEIITSAMKPRPLLAAVLGFFAGHSAGAQTVAPGTTPRDADVITLNAFTVSATPANGYRAEQTVSGTLIATDVKRMPASIQVVTEALISDMDTRRVEDSIRFVSGVGLGARNEGSGGGSRSEQFVVRGFHTSQILRNGIRMQGITNSANLERIEVLKGPSSIFFGASDPGGVINVITKKPLPERYASVRLGFGDDSYKYAEFDFNQPVVEKKLLLRIMGSRLDTEGWRKFWRDEQDFLSGVVEWNPNATTRVTLDAQHRKQGGIQERLGDVFLTSDRPAPFSQQLLTGAAHARAVELGALTPSDTYDDEANFYSVTVTQKLGDRLLFSAVHGASDSNRLQRTTVTRNRIAVNDNHSYFDRPGISSIGAINRTFNLNVLATFDVVGTKNKLVAGWDRSEIGTSERLFAWANNSPFTTKRFLFDAGTEADIFGVRRYPTLAEIGTPGGPGAVVNNPWNKPVWQQGAYVTNQMSLLGDRLTVLAGTRWSDLRGQGRTAWTPQYGATFALTPEVSLYALHSESFRPNGRASTIDPNSPFFPPEAGVGDEAGVKFTLLRNTLTGTAAVFRVDKTNVRRVNSGAAVLGINGASLTDGERSDGFEFDLVWTPVRNVSIIAAYAHIDARIVADVINTASSPDLNGDGRPDTIGLPLRGNSPDSWSLWVKYDFTAKPLAGLTLSAGYQRRDGPIPLDASFARKFVVEDGYSRLDLMAGYATRVFQRRVKFQVNVDNVTDEFYADKSLGYANPRTWRVSATTTF
ncbi:MAG: TonB-dependent receptor [Opitutaceae bacterium]|nr:TonB-dependent receptor [Opitutaceae bacterium]